MHSPPIKNCLNFLTSNIGLSFFFSEYVSVLMESCNRGLYVMETNILPRRCWTERYFSHLIWFLGRPNLTKVPMRRRILVTYTWASRTRVHKFARQHLKISRDRQNKNYDHRSVNQWGCYKRRTRTPTGTLFSWEAAVNKRTSVSLTLDTFCLSGRKWKSFIWRLSGERESDSLFWWKRFKGKKSRAQN